MIKVAVVILNWNGYEMLRSFLPSVIKYTKAENTEVYVADNGSVDQSVSLLQMNFPQVKLIIMEENMGFADGYNIALSKVKAEYVVLLNSDVEVTEGWLEPMVEYMDEHPEIAACQPKILNWRKRECFEYAGAAGGFIDYYGYPFCRGRIFNTIETDGKQYDTVSPVFWATGAALFIRLEDYRNVGGLDGRFFAHMEEIDLCWRLQARGRGVACVPQSIVYHLGGGTLKKENPRKTYLNFRNNLLMLYKNLPDEEFNKVMRVRAFLDYLAALFFLIKGQWPNARAVLRARREFKNMRNNFLSIRANNIKNTTVLFLPGRIKSSILWQFYVRGKKYFSELSI